MDPCIHGWERAGEGRLAEMVGEVREGVPLGDALRVGRLYTGTGDTGRESPGLRSEALIVAPCIQGWERADRGGWEGQARLIHGIVIVVIIDKLLCVCCVRF